MRSRSRHSSKNAAKHVGSMRYPLRPVGQSIGQSASTIPSQLVCAKRETGNLRPKHATSSALIDTDQTRWWVLPSASGAGPRSRACKKLLARSRQAGARLIPPTRPSSRPQDGGSAPRDVKARVVQWQITPQRRCKAMCLAERAQAAYVSGCHPEENAPITRAGA